MRGHIRKAKIPPERQARLPQGHYVWDVVITRPLGNGKYKPTWKRVEGTRQDAEAKCSEMLADIHRNEFVEPSRLTVGVYLHEHWLPKVQKRVAPRTYECYRNVVEMHVLKSALASVRLQQLTPSNVEDYHHAKKAEGLSHATLRLHQVVFVAALGLAKRDKLVRDNAASEATERPTRSRQQRKKLMAWTPDEAQRVMAEAREEKTMQTAALIAVALDSGARLGELQALQWDDIDLATGKLRIERQLLKWGATPVYGDTKTRQQRMVTLAEATLVLLRKHKSEQAELMMANRTQYAEHRLIFAQSWEHRFRSRGHWQLGGPLPVGTVRTLLRRLVKRTGVRRITIHGLRHTCATLALAAGVQPKVVQERLGHTNIATTLDKYGHVLEGQQAEAAKRLSEQIHGR